MRKLRLGKHWALSIQPKLSKILKPWQMVLKFSRKSSQKFRKLFNFRNTNHSTKNSKNSGSKAEWKKNPGNFFRKFGYTSRGCPRFWEFWKMLFLSLLEVAENSNQTFWLNGKRPLRFSRNKINFFPRDQSLSVYYYPLTS